jgi:Cu2+-exporting ATPase
MEHNHHNMSPEPEKYTCPMHSEVVLDKPGQCPKCGMTLVPITSNNKPMDHSAIGHVPSHKASDGHGSNHAMKPLSEMSFWEKIKMSMTMAMGMEHGGLAGREMAKLMEEDIRNKFFFSLLFTIPIILYSPLGEKILRITLPSPLPSPWLLLLLTTPVFF